MIRLAVLLLLVAAPLAAADEVVDHGAWREFVPTWHEGPGNATFRNRTVPFYAGERWATDGSSWIYGAADDQWNASADDCRNATTHPPEAS